MKVIQGGLDMLFILRPMLFYPVWTFFLAGSLEAGMRLNGNWQFPVLPVIFSVTLITGSAFILNQIKDKETDRINNKLFFIADGIVKEKSAFIEAGVLAFAGLLIVFFISFKIFLLAAALFLVSGICYNYPPFSWKDRPVMGMVTNSLAGLFIFSMGWIARGGSGYIPLYVLPYAVAGGAVYLDTTLPDVKGDREAGKITFAVKYGHGLTIRLASILEISVVITAFLLSDRFIFYASVVVLPFFVLSAIKPDLKNGVRAVKFSIIILLAGVCWFYPALFAVVMVVFFITKIYYKKRFNFNYPSLKA